MTDINDESVSGLGAFIPQNVETPCGTPEPPNAASTVARPPPKPRRLPNINFLPNDIEGAIKNFNLENSTVSFSKSSHEDTPLPSPCSPRSSGLHSHNDSKETVIAKPTGIDPKYLMPTPGPQNLTSAKGCITGFFDSTILEDVEPPSGIFLLEMTKKDDSKIHEFQNLAAEQDCADFQEVQVDLDQEEQCFAQRSGSYVSFGGDILQDMAEMAQHQAENIAAWVEDQTGFQSAYNQDDMLKAAEASNEERNKFEMIEVSSNSSKKFESEEEKSDKENISDHSGSTLKSESITDYFQLKTSNLGLSLGSNSGSKLMASVRPNFGLEIKNSPKPKPVAMITPEEVVKEAVDLSESKRLPLTPHERQMLHEVAKMVLDNSSLNEPPSFYAEKVLKKWLERQKQELEATLHVTQCMPSFLDDSNDLKAEHSALKSRNSSVITTRHSSPKKKEVVEKSKIPRRVPMGNITNSKVRSDEAKESTKQPSMPIESNRLCITWVSFTQKLEEQFVTLRNLWTDKAIRVSLYIKEDSNDCFSFTQSSACDSEDSDHWKSGSAMDVTIGASSQRDIFISFQPKMNLNSTNAVLVIKPHGLLKVNNRTLKSQLKLQAFHSTSLKVSIFINDQYVREKMHFEDKHIKIRVKNEGDCEAYFKFENLHFVLPAFSEKVCPLILKDKVKEIDFVFGPEITRQILKTAPKNMIHEEQRLFLENFEGETSLRTSSVFCKVDAKYFNLHQKKKSSKIHIAQEKSFLPLPCTELEETTRKEKKKIWLDKETIYFPTVTMTKGTSVAKVTIKNRTDKSVKFSIDNLPSPFENNHHIVEVRPRYYLSIPILFRPTRDNQKSTVSLVLRSPEQTLTATLVGASQYFAAHP